MLFNIWYIFANDCLKPILVSNPNQCFRKSVKNIFVLLECAGALRAGALVDLWPYSVGLLAIPNSIWNSDDHIRGGLFKKKFNWMYVASVFGCPHFY